MLYKLYRISDAGRQKVKVSGALKINCLRNFIAVFGTEGLYVFADRCSDITLAQIKELGLDPMLIDCGNSGSFRHVVDYAINNFKSEDAVYLVEDDYWHLPVSAKALSEGLEIADYVSLYDFPDKYHNAHGTNPYVTQNSERSRVYLTSSSHWKTSNSTTMTFAARVSTLKQDKAVLWNFTKENIPDDFGMFLVLTAQSPWPLLFNKGFINRFWASIRYYPFVKRRTLITALPGISTHVEEAYLSPLTDWKYILQPPADVRQ